LLSDSADKYIRQVAVPDKRLIGVYRMVYDTLMTATRKLKRPGLWLTGFYSLVALVLTWPTVLHLTGFIPLGSEHTTTVPLFNLWTLGWNVSRLQHGYQGYWEAPIFYPSPGAFAFSEPQPLTGLLGWVFWFISPAAAYNLILIMFLVMNALVAYNLLRHRGLAATPALLGGLLTQSLPFLAHERGVLQLQALFGPLWALDGLWSLMERPSWLAGVQLGLGIAITFLTSEYYALFLGLMLVTAVPFLLPTFRRRPTWVAIAAACVIAGLLILPVAIPQLAAIKAMGFSRSLTTITNGSAELSEYLQVSPQLASSRWLPLPDGGGQYLFPGSLIIVLAVMGIVVGVSRTEKQRWTGYLLAATAVAFLGSLGLNLHLGGWQPYLLLRDFLPGFADLRSPFRLAYWVQIYLALLGALGLDWLWSRRRLAGVALAGLTFLELMPLPVRLTAVQPPIDISNIISPAIFLPFPSDRGTAAYADTAAWMVATLDTPVILVNGYSGYFPQLQSQLRPLLANFPSSVGLVALRSVGVQTVIIRADWLNEGQKAQLADSIARGDLVWVENQNGLTLYRLSDLQLHPAQAYAGGWALDVTLTETAVHLAMYAAVPDNQMYVLTPETASLEWRVRLTGPDNRVQVYDVSPANTVLLYHGSDRWLHVKIPRPEMPGNYMVAVQDMILRREIGQEVITIPPGR
jgi:hypothetical protein